MDGEAATSSLLRVRASHPRWAMATIRTKISHRPCWAWPTRCARGIPFALASGYGDWALPEASQNRPRLTKPFTAHELEAQVLSLRRGQGAIERAGTSPA